LAHVFCPAVDIGQLDNPSASEALMCKLTDLVSLGNTQYFPSGFRPILLVSSPVAASWQSRMPDAAHFVEKRLKTALKTVSPSWAH